MRVKITAKEYGVEKLEFGKQYGMGYYGASFFDEFVFTRKNKIELCEYDENGKKKSSVWCSKKELKRLIKSGSIQCMGVRMDD